MNPKKFLNNILPSQLNYNTLPISSILNMEQFSILKISFSVFEAEIRKSLLRETTIENNQ